MKQVLKPLNELNLRLLRFAEIMAAGTCSSCAAAAVQAGFTKVSANSRSHEFLGRSRETAMYPALWDYYEELRIKRLRKFDVTVDKVVEELRTLAFSDISDYVELPSKEVHDRVKKFNKRANKLNRELQPHIDPKTGMFYDGLPQPVLDQCQADAKKLREYNEKIDELIKGPGYSVRIKFREEIPPELMPAVSEIRETKDGLVVKLHSKLDAIEKLAQWLKMYAEGKQDEGKDLTSLNLWVSGSRSNLLTPQQDENAA